MNLVFIMYCVGVATGFLVVGFFVFLLVYGLVLTYRG